MVINASQWGVGQAITMNSREALIREVLYTELCTKRKEQLAAFADGLKAVPGFYQLLQKYPHLLQNVLCIHESRPSALVLVRAFDIIKTNGPHEEKMAEWLQEYVKQLQPEPAN